MRAIRMALCVVLAVFLWQQGVTLLGADGIMSKYTFLEGFTRFDDLMLADPLTKAGLIDLVVLMIFMVIVIANGVPRVQGRAWIVAGLIVAGLVYPGLAVLLFLILYWKRFGQFRPPD